MKREILFKAKRKNNSIMWVEGYFHFYNETPVISIDNGLTYFIDIDTLCQYTGLIDKNGNKIFENDKLNYPITPTNGKTTIIPYVVVFNVDGFQVLNLIKKFKAPYVDGLFYRASKRMNYKDWVKCEIIGNIHD